VTIAKINKIEVTNFAYVKKYDLVVENNQGSQIKITALQSTTDSTVEVVKVQPYQTNIDATINQVIQTVKSVN
jgi:hypothetical protein